MRRQGWRRRTAAPSLGQARGSHAVSHMGHCGRASRCEHTGAGGQRRRLYECKGGPQQSGQSRARRVKQGKEGKAGQRRQRRATHKGKGGPYTHASQPPSSLRRFVHACTIIRAHAFVHACSCVPKPHLPRYAAKVVVWPHHCSAAPALALPPHVAGCH